MATPFNAALRIDLYSVEHLSKILDEIAWSPQQFKSFALRFGFSDRWSQVQDSQPEHDGSCDQVGGEEPLTASMIAGGDAAPILQRGEQVVDPVSRKRPGSS